MKLSIVTTILATGSLVAATPTPTPANRLKRIIGGTNATIDQFPYQVSIQRRVDTFFCISNVHTCGGIIIAPTKILTAAHCALNDDGSVGRQFQVRAGSSDWTRGGQLVDVKNVTVHPKYKYVGNHANDIAVLTLKKNLTLGDRVAVADLAGAEEDMPGAGTEVVVAGWGQTRARKGQPSRSLRSLKTKVVLRWMCEFRYLRYGGLASRNFCAGDWTELENTWSGDSGGALFDVQRKKVVGVVSYGLDNPKRGFPTVFASIARYREYLAQVANV